LQELSLEGNFIPDPQAWFPTTAVELFPDAACRDSGDSRKGWGCCNPRTGEYIRGVWPDYILKNEVRNGRKWGRALSIWEGYGWIYSLAKFIQAR
jgi:hypothetical protein